MIGMHTRNGKVKAEIIQKGPGTKNINSLYFLKNFRGLVCSFVSFVFPESKIIGRHEEHEERYNGHYVVKSLKECLKIPFTVYSTSVSAWLLIY